MVSVRKILRYLRWSFKLLTKEKLIVLDLFAKGLSFYKSMEFLNAKLWFSRALETDSMDGPSRLYLERCEYYVSNPPEKDWDGVFVMTTK